MGNRQGQQPARRTARIDRRSFVGYVVGGVGLMAVADLTVGAAPASAIPIPSAPQIPEVYDLNDFLTHCTLPTSTLIAIHVDEAGDAHFALPRMEVGQGITTSTAMIIADELDLPLDRVHVTLAPARPELVFNQLTGGSNTTISTYTPVRVAAAVARKALLDAAAILLGSVVDTLVAKSGVISAPGGASVTYGEVAASAATPTTTTRVKVTLKDADERQVVGTPRRRKDALAAVTGAKQFALDLQVPGALPTMVCRAPDLNGTPRAVRNAEAVLAMPGVTHVAAIATGVAVRAQTFGQCIDAVRALDVEWNPGTVPGQSQADILSELRKAELPLIVPRLGASTVEGDFVFHFRSGSPLEPNCAVADVRDGEATIWGGLKSPITAQARIAEELGLPQGKVTVNVVEGGGSFGRKLFFDGALEAARASRAFGAPVKLMWHRADEPRQGRVHPMATSRIRASVLLGSVISFEQRHTSVATDFTHGLGERITAEVAALPTGLGNLGFSETVFMLSQELPYDFGAVTQLLDETLDTEKFNTSSVRNIYSPDVATANELIVDQLAARLRQDPVAFRRSHLKSKVVQRVLERAAQIGEWGRPMPAGTAQGIAIHKEYKGATAVLVEIDCRPATVNRRVRDAVTGPRVTKAVVVVDCGLAINPLGVEAQMMGGFSDGMAQALTYSNHLVDGHFLEASWDNSAYTRQWNTPFEFVCEVMDSESPEPGGVGEAGVAASMAAVACAWARATGTMPTEFPINYRDPLHFEPKSFIPSVPASPTDGLSYTR